jgi:hypothetical protein
MNMFMFSRISRIFVGGSEILIYNGPSSAPAIVGLIVASAIAISLIKAAIAAHERNEQAKPYQAPNNPMTAERCARYQRYAFWAFTGMLAFFLALSFVVS